MSSSAELNEVLEMSSEAALKIISHSRANLPTLVAGQLLGLNIGATLEVTDVFPLPFKMESSGEMSYEFEMMSRLNSLGVDNNTVGWYQSSYMGMHVTEFLVNTQRSYQKDIHNSVVIVYDPLLTSAGALSFRAFKLSDEFMQLFEKNQFSAAELAELDFTSSSMFKELPTKLSLTSLGKLIVEYLALKPEIQDKFESFDLSTSDFFTNNLDVLLYCLQDLQKERQAYSTWQRTAHRAEEAQQNYIARRKLENEALKAAGKPLLPQDLKQLSLEAPAIFKNPEVPSQLETLLLNYRAISTADSLRKYAGVAILNQQATRSFGE